MKKYLTMIIGVAAAGSLAGCVMTPPQPRMIWVSHDPDVLLAQRAKDINECMQQSERRVTRFGAFEDAAGGSSYMTVEPALMGTCMTARGYFRRPVQPGEHWFSADGTEHIGP